MIRNKWLPHATALFSTYSRNLSSSPRHLSSSRLLSTPNPSKPSRWTIPGRENAPTLDNKHPTAQEPDELAQWRSSSPNDLKAQKLQPHEELSRQRVAKSYAKRQVPQEAAAAPQGREKFMLTIKGLPPTLRSSDFRRLSGQHLSDWKDSINEVCQERDPWTLEPLGTYRISFSSGTAAELYEAKLSRLLQLARIKLHSTTGLWTSDVPPQLRGQGDFADELARFTLLPGSYSANPSTSRSRIKGRWPWQHLMDLVVERSGFNGRPAAVLLEQSHPSFLTEHIQEFIQTDGHERGNPWLTGFPYHLMTTFEEKLDFGSSESTRRPLVDDLNFRNKMMSRFVIPCKSPEVAWRFIRSWNQRTIEGEVDGHPRRALITTSFVEF